MPKEMQFAFRVEQELGERIKRAAEENEEIPWADFIRKLLRLAMQQYDSAGSLHALRSSVTRELLQRQTTINRGVHERENRASAKKHKSDRAKETA